MKMESSTTAKNTHVTTVSPDHALMRLDQFLCTQFSGYSRAYMQKLIDKGMVQIDGTVVHKASTPVKIGMCVTVCFTLNEPHATTSKNVDHIQVEVIFEHEHFLIIHKPAYLNVHAPGSSYELPTLVDWLIARMPYLTHIGDGMRPGIVHRLDKDTSGLMIIPKNNHAHAEFGRLFAQRQIKKTYHAYVVGKPPASGTIHFAIGRHPTNPTKMSHFSWGHSRARAAQSSYKVLEYFDQHALVEVKPLTGRTHQIRVHCAAIGHPLVADKVYGTSSPYIDRQALHAYALEFVYEDQQYFFTAPMPADIAHLATLLRKKS